MQTSDPMVAIQELLNKAELFDGRQTAQALVVHSMIAASLSHQRIKEAIPQLEAQMVHEMSQWSPGIRAAYDEQLAAFRNTIELMLKAAK
jgi:MoxR-like ATPase